MNRRICVLRQNYFPWEAHVRKNVEALAEAGFQVDVVCLREKGAAPRERFASGRVTRLPLTHRRTGKLRYLAEYVLFFLMATWLMAWRSLRQPYGVVEVYNIPDALVFAALPAKLRGSKIVLYMFELMPEQVRDEYAMSAHSTLIRILRWLERRAVQFADRIVTVSPYDARIVSARSEPRNPPVVILNVPDERLFHQPSDQSSPSERAFRLVTHGSLLKRYGIDTLVQAMPLIRKRIPDAEAWIIGEGEHRAALQAMAANLGLGQAVRFINWRPIEDIPQLLSQADIGIVPARVPWLLPNKLFEYVAMAKPVVASDTPSLRTIFPDGEVSYFTPGNAEELAERVIELHENAALRQERVTNAATVLQRYCWANSKRSYVDMHRQLLGVGQ